MRYAIDSDRCIDCGACGRICTFEAIVTADGQLASRLRLSEWFTPDFDLPRCNQCGECLAACPANCIQFTSGELLDPLQSAGFPRLTRPKLCIGCGFCLKACSQGAVHSFVLVQ